MTQQFKSDKKAMTLVELILAILLLNVIIMTGLSMELGIRRIFSSTDFEAQLLTEAAPILTKVAADIMRSVGDNASPITNYPYNYSYSGGYYRYLIRKDQNANGVADAGDIFADYRYSPSSYTLEYRPDSASGGYVSLSDKVTSFSISAPVNGTSNISLTLRKNVTLAANYTNPQITLNSIAQYRGYSYR